MFANKNWNPFLFLVIVIVPLVMHVKHLSVPHDLWMLTSYHDEYDIFSYWKARTLIIFAALSIGCWSFSKIEMPLFSCSYMYLVFLFLSTIFSDSPMLSMYGLPNYNEGALVLASYIAVLIGATQFDRKYLQRSIFTSICLVGFFCLLQQVYGNFLEIRWLKPLVSPDPIQALTRPLFGTLMNPNHLGLYCALLFPFVLAQLQWKFVPALGLLWFMTIGSMSRAALVSVFVSSVFIFVKTKRWFCIFLLSGMLAIIAFVFRHQYHMHIFDRLYIWRRSLRLLLNTVFLGKGAGTFLIFFPQGEGPFWNIYVDRPHNFYLQMWHASGLLSLLCLMTIFLMAYRKGDLAQKAAILGFLVAGLFTDSMVGVSAIFFAIVGSCWMKKEEVCV